jgi:hypothetical protein
LDIANAPLDVRLPATTKWVAKRQALSPVARWRRSSKRPCRASRTCLKAALRSTSTTATRRLSFSSCRWLQARRARREGASSSSHRRRQGRQRALVSGPTSSLSLSTAATTRQAARRNTAPTVTKTFPFPAALAARPSRRTAAATQTLGLLAVTFAQSAQTAQSAV